MAESIAIIGGIAACTQLAKYGFSFLRSLSDGPANMRNTPDTIEVMINDVEGFLDTAKSLVLDPSEVSHSATLRAMIDRCINSAVSLQKLLQTVAIDKSDSSSVKLRKMITFQRRSRRISKCFEDIERCKGNLQLHLSTLIYQGSGLHIRFPSTQDDRLTSGAISGPAGTSFSNLPQKSTFIGRESILNLVSQALASPALGCKACLVGLGGIGKTQAALEYTDRICRSNPDISIFWINASSQGTFMEGLVCIGHRLKRNEKNEINIIKVREIVAWLESSDSGRWILVIDDLDLGTFGNREILDNVIPSNPNGSVLFTTRNKETAFALVEDPRCVIQMEPMKRGEAFKLAESQLGTGIPNPGFIAPLVHHLDYIPLAICRATSFMRMTSTAPRAYLQLSQKSEAIRADLLTQAASMVSEGTPTPLISFFVSVDAIREQDEAAAQLLFTMACVEPSKIPLRLFTAGEMTSKVANAFALLNAYSLLSSNNAGDLFNMSELVHLGVRSYLRMTDQFHLHASHVFRNLADAFPQTKDQYRRLVGCKSFLPHAIAVWNAVIATEKADTISTISYQTIKSLASRVALCLRILGRYEEAKRFAQHALEWSLIGTDPLSESALTCRGSIVDVDQYLGNITAAATSIDKILSLQTSALARNDPIFIPTLRRKGLSLQSQGHYIQAQSYHRSAVLMSISHYGVIDIKTLDEKHGYALALLGQRKINEALGMLQYVLEAMSDVIGLMNPKTLSVLSNVGAALQQQERWMQSWACVSQALAGREQVLGVDHPHTLQCKANLAQIYVAKGEPMKAEEVTREVLQSHQQKLGKEHPLSVHILQNLGFLLFDQERFEEAREILRRVVVQREKCLGVDHPDTLFSAFHLAETYAQLGDYATGLPVANKVLNARRSLPMDDSDRAASEAQVGEMEQAYLEWLSGRTLVEERACC